MAQRNVRASRNSGRMGRDEIFDANAARKLNAVPEREIQRRAGRRDNLVRLSEKELRKARRRGLNPLRAAVSVVCVAVVFTMVMSLIYGQVQLTELTEEINTAQSDLAQLESVEIQLQMKATSNMNVDEIKAYAENELGMEKIKNSQISYVNLAQQDVGTVVEKDQGNIFQRFWSALTSWMS